MFNNRRIRTGVRKMISTSQKGIDFGMNNSSHNLVSETPNEHKMAEFFLARDAEGRSTISRDLTLLFPTKKTWKEYVIKFAAREGYQVYMTGAGARANGSIFRGHDLCIKYGENYEGTTISVYGDVEEVSSMCDELTTKFKEVKSTIYWYYGSSGENVSIPLNSNQLPIDEMYPWMDRTLQDYWDDYMNNNASILLLIGAPGTGKTSWIRGFLNHTGSDAMVTYDPALLAKDGMFAEFMAGDTNVLVIEDADNFLRPREDGNDLMHKFLNVGSGLISNAGKKLIFSTNLPSIRDIDAALLRPGRCYDVLDFRKLKLDEQIKLAKVMGIDFTPPEVYTDMTAAEVFNQVPASTPKKTTKKAFGFF